MRALAIATLVALAFPPVPPAAAGVTWIDQDRGVYASATASEPAASAFQDAANDAPDFGLQAPSIRVDATTPNAIAHAGAVLVSRVAGPVVHAIGSAQTEGESTAIGVTHVPADAFFELIFDATETGGSDLFGMVRAAAELADAYASVELVDVDGARQLASYEAHPGQETSFGTSLPLVAGTRYRLTAFALCRSATTGVASDTADASFVVALAVPEPRAALLEASAVAVALALGRVRRRGAPRMGPEGTRPAPREACPDLERPCSGPT